MDLADKISQQIGHPVSIDKVTTKWDWIYLKVSIKNLTVSETKDSGPLFMAGEIVSTVDALNSLRTFSLKFKHLLIRSPRMVMQWNGIEHPVVLGLGREDVSGNVDPAAILKILAMQRRITIEDGDLHLQGKHGADLPFMGVRLDFRNTGNNQYNIMARGTVAAAVQPEFVIAVNYQGELGHFDSAMINFEVKTNNIKLAELFNFIPKYRQNIINGAFADFDFKGTIQNGAVREIKSNFNINKITLDKDTYINGGIGHIEYSPGSNKCKLLLQHITVGNDKLFTQPINIDSISTNLNYHENEDGSWGLVTESARIKFLEMEAVPQINMHVANNHLDQLTIHSQLSEATVRKLLVLLPDKKLSDPLCDWLKRSLIDGYVASVDAEFSNDKLSWSIALKEVELKYSSEWPSVAKIDATLAMIDDNLSINATKASILGNQLRTLGVTFSEYKNVKYGVVNISGALDSNLESGLAFLKQSPLQATIGAELEPFNPTGPMGLDLSLKINVADSNVPVKVAAKVALKNDTLHANALGLTLNNITGNLIITNSLLRSENIRLTLLGQPATALIVLDDHKPANLKMSIKSPIEISELKKMFPAINMDNVSGKANIMASVDIPWGDGKLSKVLTVSTDMVGVNVNLPPPFNKKAEAKMPLKLLYNMTHNNEGTLKLKYAEMIDSILFIKDNKLHGGHVAVNKKLDIFNETENLHILGNIKTVDWDTWKPMFQSKETNEWLPIVLDLNINTLKFQGSDYNALKIKYYTEHNELFVDCPIVTGTFVLSPDHDKIDVKLSRLNIPEQRSSNSALLDYIQEKRLANQLPFIQFYCDNLLIKKHTFKKINVELLPRTYGYEITNFAITNDNIMLQAQGRWQMENKQLTVISGNAYTQNFGKVLAEWGYVDSMTRGKGEINFSIQWDGSPTDFDLHKIEGASHVDLRSGSLTNVNPGLGRVIGLLSLESIQRRLQLDFSDLLSRGFAFDKFVADVNLQPDTVTSENILINSPAAKIEINGKTAIKSKQLDFTMFVTPKVGAGLPIAAAIAAGNPAVGAAIWLFDKASGSKISEIAKYKYSVTGTWDKPKIDEISSSHTNTGNG
jgi:uncharacterized protein (TIGR02099 family)